MESLPNKNGYVSLVAKDGFGEDHVDQLVLDTHAGTFKLQYGGPMVLFHDYSGNYKLVGDNSLILNFDLKDTSITLNYNIIDQEVIHDVLYFNELTNKTVEFDRSPFSFQSGMLSNTATYYVRTSNIV
jgi:hypothetical protein